jgi:hypothetical protein
MKKIIAVLLSLMLILGTAYSLAEAADEKFVIGEININGAFTLKCNMMEGYKLIGSENTGSQFLAVFASEDPSKPIVQLSVAYDEIIADVERLNDLEDNPVAMAALEASFVANDPEVEITYDETGLGTRLLIARGYSKFHNYIDFMSIYKGHMIELVVTPNEKTDKKILTDEQYEVARRFLTEMDFVPTETAAVAAGAEAGIEDGTYLVRINGYHEEDNTVDLTIREGIILNEAEVEALTVGSELEAAGKIYTVSTIEKKDNGDVVINGLIDLENYGGEYIVVIDGKGVTNDTGMNLKISDSVSMMDDYDLETGKPTEATVDRDAATVLDILKGKYPQDIGLFERDLFVSTENGEIVLIQR